MKKALVFILTFLLCFSCISCNAPNANAEPPSNFASETVDNSSENTTTEEPTEKPRATQDSNDPIYSNIITQETLDGFSTYLDRMNIIPGRTQEEFAEQLATYSHKGEALIGEYRDTPYGKLYGLSIEDNDQLYSLQYADFSHVVGDKETKVNIYISFPIENFDIPFGITFEDTMMSSLVKSGITRIAPFSTFIPDGDNQYRMTLYKDDTCRLAYMSYDADSPCNKSILYTESYAYTDEQGLQVDVTRSVELFFFIGFFNEPEYVTNLAAVNINMSETIK